MPIDYVSLFVALLVAYQSCGADWSHAGRRGPYASLAVLAALPVLWVVPRLSFDGLRLGWAFSGILLSGFAFRHMRKPARRLPLALVALDAAGTWAALALTGAPQAAVVAGALAGVVLPLALGPWPRVVTRIVPPLGVVTTGAVGLRLLVKAAVGASGAWPLGILAIPWLMLWDVRHGRAAREQ